jgi:5S rRNA maturation endonuclease (ribonuclease M5)
MKENELGETCSTHGSYEKFIKDRSKNLKGGDHLWDLDENGTIILRWIYENLKGGDNLWDLDENGTKK